MDVKGYIEIFKLALYDYEYIKLVTLQPPWSQCS